MESVEFREKDVRKDHDSEDDRGVGKHRHRPAGKRRRAEGSAQNRTCGGYHKPALTRPIDGAGELRSHADGARLCIHDDRLRGYPFRPVSPLLGDHGRRRYPHGEEGSPGTGTRPASGIPYRVCDGGGAGARYGKIGKDAGDLLPGIGEDRNDGRQPGLLVRGVHPRRGLRRVGGVRLRRRYGADRSARSTPHLGAVPASPLPPIRAAGPDPAGGGGDRGDRSRVRVPRHHLMPSNAAGGLPHGDGAEGNLPPPSREPRRGYPPQGNAQHRGLLPQPVQVGGSMCQNSCHFFVPKTFSKEIWMASHFLWA